MKIIAGLFITRKTNDVDQAIRDMESYIYDVDHLMVLDMSEEGDFDFYREIQKYENTEYTRISDKGEACNIHKFLTCATEKSYDLAVILYQDYYYPNDAFKALVNGYNNDYHQKPAIVTPLPLYECIPFEQKAQTSRLIKGAHLIGALIDVCIYMKTGGFNLDYYQGYYDYEYCIRARALNHPLVLYNNIVLRNRNYRIVSRKVLSMTFSTYEKSAKDLYYETRNRHYIWRSMLGIDPDFIMDDKKSYKLERNEMRMADPEYKNKKHIYQIAYRDYKRHITGKVNYF